MTTDEQSQMVDDISSILMRGRYGRKGVGRPSDNPIDLRDARRIVEYVAARDARVRRDAAREALDGLYEDASQEYRIGLQGDDQERMDAAEAVLRATYEWMDNYPEETP